MKKNILIALGLFGALFYASCQNKQSADLKSEVDTVSYSLGVSIAQNLKMNGFDSINAAAFAEGINDFMNDENPKIHPSMADQLISAYITTKRARAFEETKKEGEDFLASNKDKENIKTTESGLQYEVVEEGSGISPDENDNVTVHYTGKTIDGEVFDSSVERGEPVTFQLNQVIRGWSEGLQLMKEGAKWKLYVPAELGYGERGTPDGSIPPNSALIFDVELISVEKVD